MKATIVKTIIAAVVLAAIMLGPGETENGNWCPAMTLGCLAALAACGIVLRKLDKSRR